jgi:hypothetical protein
LTYTRLAPIAQVPIYLADVLRSEEMRSASHLDKSLISPTVTITVAYADNIRGYTCPNTMHQPFRVIFAEDPLGLFFVKHFQGRSSIRELTQCTPFVHPEAETVSFICLSRRDEPASTGHSRD